MLSFHPFQWGTAAVMAATTLWDNRKDGFRKTRNWPDPIWSQGQEQVTGFLKTFSWGWGAFRTPWWHMATNRVVSPVLLSWCSSTWALKGCRYYGPRVVWQPLVLTANSGITHMILVLQSYRTFTRVIETPTQISYGMPKKQDNVWQGQGPTVSLGGDGENAS